jgi:hypothetical protein
MYTSHIGKQFLNVYNRKNSTEYTARTFFHEIYFPLFFGHAKFMMSPQNTPFFTLIRLKQTESLEARKKELDNLQHKIDAYNKSGSLSPDMSCALGYGSYDDMGTTSGQLTNLKLPVQEEEIYASWIGAGLGIGIAGGYNVLMDNEEVLWAIFEGWPIYREYIHQTPGIDNKIDTWNGIWLAHRLSPAFNPERVRDNFNPIDTGKDGSVQLSRPEWTKFFFGLSNFLSTLTITGYIYQFSQMNKTIGFIQFYLQSARRLHNLYRKLFPADSAKLSKDISELYETELGFATACQNGSIGLTELKPKGLQKYMAAGSKSPSVSDFEKNQFSFNMYQTWIVAMLNNEQFLSLAIKGALALQAYAAGSKGGKTTRINEIDTVLSSRGKRQFTESITILLNNAPEQAQIFNELVEAVHRDISADNTAYFIALLRFKYALPESTLQSQS